VYDFDSGDWIIMKLKVTLLALPIALLVGCTSNTAVRYDSSPHYKYSDVYYRSGPPPHAPAHGYRHHHHSHDMIYDSGIRAYILVGLPGYYYDDGFYFRYSNIGWQFSAYLNDGWRVTDERRVPKTLWKTRSNKHYYYNREQPRNNYQDNKGKSDRDQSRNNYQDNRGKSDREQPRNSYQDNRGKSDREQPRNNSQDNREKSGGDQSRNNYQDNKAKSGKDQFRNRHDRYDDGNDYKDRNNNYR
tara:strand:- start:144350 stop:145081 length:732 start_codon:yes stop_codon:yes gene_type:complete